MIPIRKTESRAFLFCPEGAAEGFNETSRSRASLSVS
jgi:hypothetical protein